MKKSIIILASLLTIVMLDTKFNVSQALTCNSVTVNLNWFHTVRVTTCDDGSGTAYHTYPFGQYCVHTWDGQGAEFRRCGTVAAIEQ